MHILKWILELKVRKESHNVQAPFIWSPSKNAKEISKIKRERLDQLFARLSFFYAKSILPLLFKFYHSSPTIRALVKSQNYTIILNCFRADTRRDVWCCLKANDRRFYKTHFFFSNLHWRKMLMSLISINVKYRINSSRFTT